MDYVLYSTSNSDYQSWQCKLLEYTFKKVKQPGKLIRLCSFNTHNSDREFDTSDIAEIIKLPDYRTRWTEYTNNLDKDYGIVNKTESLKYWLSYYPGLKDSDNVLLIDPDMVFSKAIDINTTSGTIIGQRWIDDGASTGNPFQTYASHIKDKVTKDTVFMYPYIATVGDLRKIINKYIDLTYKMRLDNYPHLWESEMYALIIASLNEESIKVKTLDNLGFCLTWAEREKYTSKEFVDSTYIFHYPWSINDNEGNRIFNKQDYTSLTKQEHWYEINPNLATTYLEQKFLSILDEYNQHKKIKQYWQHPELSDAILGYYPENKYLVFKPWPGGFNNIRMSLEIAACIAFLQNRILVLPLEYRMYLLQNVNSFSTFFDIDDIGIKTISFQDFTNKFNISTWEDIEDISYTVDMDIVNTLLTTLIPSEDIIKGRKIENLNKLLDNPIVYFKDNLLGSFYLNIYSERNPELCKYVARHIHYNNNIFFNARKVIDLIGNYYAIHIRRGDFQYHDLKLPIETIYNNIKNTIPEGSKLYISTDETNKEFFNLLSEHYSLYFYDYVKHLIDPNINEDLIGPIEQIICTGAKTFIGNKLSTFSSYIYRLRGYIGKEDKRFLTYNIECFPDKEEEYWWGGVWAREYSEAWESINKIVYFSPQQISLNLHKNIKIFVSVASYRDPRLTDTIDSLFKNQSGENEIIIGVCMQDTEENYNDFKYKNHPNVKINFIPYKEAKGVGYARSNIQDMVINEDYFLQIDSHSRAIKNWDKILINQINNCPTKKVVLSTYPNSFDPLDVEETYFNYNTCPYLKVTNIDPYEKISPVSAGVVKDKPMLGFWIAAGFIFAKNEWVKEVPYNKDFYFGGEEDHLSIISFVKGWDVYVPESSTIWHDYTDTRIQSPKKYRPLYWEDHPGVDPRLDLLKNLYENAYGGSYERTTDQFIERVKEISNYNNHPIEIEIEFDYTKIPEADPNKKIQVIIFAFKNNKNKEIFRPDIYDENIFNRTSKNITFHVYNHIHENAVKAIWFYKYDDDTFSEFIELPITKHNKKYKL
jgi:hypothetical protein